MEGKPRSFMWNRIAELESAIEDRRKIAQAGREIANFSFLKAIGHVIKKVSDNRIKLILSTIDQLMR